MRGFIGGILTGGFVSVVGLGALSVVSEQPAGITPPETPLVDAPVVAPVSPVAEASTGDASQPNTPVGAMTIEAPAVPALPEGESGALDVTAPQLDAPDTPAPGADTDPLGVPDVVSVEGTMSAPQTPDGPGLVSQPLDPVFPNPQSNAPQVPENETDLTVSTVPDQPVMVVVPEEEAVVVDEGEDLFVVDLGLETSEPASDGIDVTPNVDAADSDPSLTPLTVPESPTIQFQGGQTPVTDGDADVTVSSSVEGQVDEDPAAPINALELYGADIAATGDKPLMSIILIDDGTMSAAIAALAGLPFDVTIAIDPVLDDAAKLLNTYRADGFEVAVLATIPEGAAPSDVGAALGSVFDDLSETIAVLDIGEAGLQIDVDVTERAMAVLASEGRGFVTASQGLTLARRAAQDAGVPSAIVYRDLDADGQDARIVRRFVDQAAFRARQESGIVLLGRVRPETISALILWGTANQDEQVAVVPLSGVLLAQ